VVNCIFYGNKIFSTSTTQNFVSSGTVPASGTVKYSIISQQGNLTNGGNNITTDPDPLFANVLTNDFSLLTGSPAINSGTSNVSIATDIIGTARPQGATFDIGAYEYISLGGSPLIVLQAFEIDANGIRAPSANGYTGNDNDLVPGSQIVYKIQIVNTGNATANAIKIYQNLPTHTTFFDIPLNSGVTENSSTVSAAPDVDYFDGRGISPTNDWVGTLSGTPSGNITRVRFNIPEMAPSSSVTVRYSVTVD
jgi:uncharacterized repeat protein (TIGR01451 family)